MSDQTKAVKRAGWYTAARIFAAVMVHTICPVTYHHVERLERDAPFILISNHLSWMDPVVLASPIKRYEVTFLGKKELTKNPIARRAVLGMHMIVVDRHNMDMEAMRACMRTLREGGILGIFPEGTRHHKGVMEEVESGTGFIALRSQVPLIPAYIQERIRPFHRTHIWIGEPIETADLRADGVNRESADALMRRITAVYRRMAEEARGE